MTRSQKILYRTKRKDRLVTRHETYLFLKTKTKTKKTPGVVLLTFKFKCSSVILSVNLLEIWEIYSLLKGAVCRETSNKISGSRRD